MTTIMSEEIFAGIVLVATGAMQALLPKKFFKFQAFINKKLFDITYEPTKATFRRYKIIGTAIALLGFYTIFFGR